MKTLLNWVTPKQTLRQGFRYKVFIEEVIPGNTVRSWGREGESETVMAGELMYQWGGTAAGKKGWDSLRYWEHTSELSHWSWGIYLPTPMTP